MVKPSGSGWRGIQRTEAVDSQHERQQPDFAAWPHLACNPAEHVIDLPIHPTCPPRTNGLPISDPDHNTVSATPSITLRGVVLGLATTVGVILYVIYVSERSGVGHFVHSQLPLLALMPFVLWIFLNVGFSRIWPSQTLKTGELLTILSMLWIVGTLPHWLGRWSLMVASPTHFASPENMYAEHFFDYLPWHVLAPTSARVLDSFWLGLPDGAPVPWEGWIEITLQWLGVSLAMVAFGYCLFVLFQTQWEDREKLAFPLAQLPLDLLRGMDGRRRLPDLFRTKLFWIGFRIGFCADPLQHLHLFHHGHDSPFQYRDLSLRGERLDLPDQHSLHAAGDGGDLSLPDGHSRQPDPFPYHESLQGRYADSHRDLVRRGRPADRRRTAALHGELWSFDVHRPVGDLDRARSPTRDLAHGFSSTGRHPSPPTLSVCLDRACAFRGLRGRLGNEFRHESGIGTRIFPADVLDLFCNDQTGRRLRGSPTSLRTVHSSRAPLLSSTCWARPPARRAGWPDSTCSPALASSAAI